MAHFTPPGSAEAHVFACLGLTTMVLVLVEVTSFDLRFGGFGNYVHDRYLIYLAPLTVLA